MAQVHVGHFQNGKLDHWEEKSVKAWVLFWVAGRPGNAMFSNVDICGPVQNVFRTCLQWKGLYNLYNSNVSIMDMCWFSCKLRISCLGEFAVFELLHRNLQSCPKFPQQLPVSGACTRYGIHLMPGEGNLLRLHVELKSAQDFSIASTNFNKKHQQTIRIHRYPLVN